MRLKIGVIAGSGFDRFLEGSEFTVGTRYGKVDAVVSRIQDVSIFFINRHGKNASLPHLINHRGNISAMKNMGVERIIALSAAGSMNRRIKIRDLVLLDQFIDFTQQPHTFSSRKAVHTDVGEPFCQGLRDAISGAAKALRLMLHKRGTYIHVSGPRYETAAEIKAFRKLGGDVVGMTVAPECMLAREIGMCYAAISLATNYAAGIEKEKLSHTGVIEVVSEKRKTLIELISKAILEIPVAKNCRC